jgi:uncharacterized protein YjbI with pentapeptide repeats
MSPPTPAICSPPDCNGIHLTNGQRCIAHATQDERQAALFSLTDHGNLYFVQGVTIGPELLEDIRSAAPKDDEGYPIFIRPNFSGATFLDDANFQLVRFRGDRTNFERSTFQGLANFGGATFEGAVNFIRTTFYGDANFMGAMPFSGDVGFLGIICVGSLRFDGRVFEKEANFFGIVCGGEAVFSNVSFRGVSRLGPLVAKQVRLEGSTFAEHSTLQLMAWRVNAPSSRFRAGGEIRIAWAAVDLSAAQFPEPCVLSGDASNFRGAIPSNVSGWWTEFDPPPVPTILSLRRANVAGLVIGRVDLRTCRFAGAHNLDKLRIEGPTPFAVIPRGLKFGRIGGQGLPIRRWTKRQTIAEEHAWRATSTRYRDWVSGRMHPKKQGWLPAECRQGQIIDEPLHPQDIATIYRDLRKRKITRMSLGRQTSITVKWKCGALPEKARGWSAPFWPYTA